MANLTPALESINPWDPQQVVARMPEASPDDSDAALARGVAAAPAWGLSNAVAMRVATLERFAAVLLAEQGSLVDLLVREAGKTQADAQAEADLLPRKIAITLKEGLARTPGLRLPSEEDATTSLPAIAWRPRGLALCLGPFNFPLHLLHGLVVPALAVGCTVIAKPSERCPALGARYAALAQAAGLGDAMQVVQGSPPLVDQLLRDPRITTVAAVGGQRMGEAVARRLAARPHCVLALELGGVNQALLLPDADQASAVLAIADGAWRMAGQRCTATRIVHVPRQRLQSITEQLLAARERWQPGATPAALVGPMIASGLREAFQLPYRSLPAGLRLLAGVPQALANPCAADPLLLSVSDPAGRAQDLYREEHFGPALIIDAYDDPSDALARMAGNPYRLAAAVFTASRARFRACAARLPYGQVNWNRPTAGARSDLPFGGCGRSGNGRPAAVAACQIFADETVVWE